MALGFAFPVSAVLQGGSGRQKQVKRSSIRLTATNGVSVEEYTAILQEKQLELVKTFEELDGSSKEFRLDKWARSESSFGVTAVLEGGSVIERGAVNTTFIKDVPLPASRADSLAAEGLGVVSGDRFSVASLALVIHPRNPNVPTLRADVRVLRARREEESWEVTWVGGGADLTPVLLFEEDCKIWHEAMRSCCSSNALYEEWKLNCDEYFYLPSRQEHRGIGGLFFDFVTDPERQNIVGRLLYELPAPWVQIAFERHALGYSEEDRNWQLQRRGRYIEFNFLFDRGVKFGINTPSPRVDAVLVSAPPLVSWSYEPFYSSHLQDQRKADLLDVLKNPRQWIQNSEQ